MASSPAVRESSKVPDLVRTPALTITSEDIALPRIYLGQFMTTAVQEQLIKPGQIFSATGQDDPDPQVLWSSEQESSGVLFHVLTLRKGKSYSEGNGAELQLFDFDDPNAPPDAWVTYSYVVCVPDVDPDVPFKLLLTRTGKNAALQINTVLKKNSISGPAWNNAFYLTATARENNKGRFFVPRIATATATKEHTAIAEQMGISMSSSVIDRSSNGEEPAI